MSHMWNFSRLKYHLHIWHICITWISLEKYKQDNFTHYLEYATSTTPLTHLEGFHFPPFNPKKTWVRKGSQCVIHAIRGDVLLLSNRAIYCSLENLALSFKSCSLFAYLHKKHRFIYLQTFEIPQKMLWQTETAFSATPSKHQKKNLFFFFFCLKQPSNSSEPNITKA